MNPSYLLISENDDHRIFQAKKALNALTDLTLSSANMGAKLHPSMRKLEVDPENLCCLLSLIADQLNVHTQPQGERG